MIIVEQKPLAEIQQMIADYKKVLILGCGTCATVCLAGGEKQVAILASSLRLAQLLTGGEKQFIEYTVKRQCEREFLAEIADKLQGVDAVLSLSCGIGMQAITETFPTLVVLPGVNTIFLGLPEEPGRWSEVCLACGDCLLDRTGGICPITRCAKGLLSGACGGAKGGKCEEAPEHDCAWILIYERLKKLGMLDKLKGFAPPKDYSKMKRPRQIEVALPQVMTPVANQPAQ